MNRIKHRGYSLDKKKWIIGDLMQTDPNTTIIEGCDATNPANFNWVDNESVGQFSTIVDIKEVEVFAGDIVKCSKGRNDVVEFKNGCFWLKYRNCSLYRYMFELQNTVEVIGNIYLNPEKVDQ